MQTRALEMIGQGQVPRALRAALALRAAGSETGGVNVCEIVDFVHDIGSQAGIKDSQLTDLVCATLHPVLSDMPPSIIRDRTTRIRLGLCPRTLANLASIDGPWSREIEGLDLYIEPAPGLEDFLDKVFIEGSELHTTFVQFTDLANNDLVAFIRKRLAGDQIKPTSDNQKSYTVGNNKYRLTIVSAPDPTLSVNGAISYILQKVDGTSFTPDDVKLINQYSFRFAVGDTRFSSLDFRFWPPVHDLEPRNFFKYPKCLQLTFPYTLNDFVGFKVTKQDSKIE